MYHVDIYFKEKKIEWTISQGFRTFTFVHTDSHMLTVSTLNGMQITSMKITLCLQHTSSIIISFKHDDDDYNDDKCNWNLHVKCQIKVCVWVFTFLHARTYNSALCTSTRYRLQTNWNWFTFHHEHVSAIGFSKKIWIYFLLL